MMDDFEVIYENVPRRNIVVSPAPQRLNERQDEGKDRKQRRRSLVLMTVSLGLICVFLLVFIIWLSITAEGDLLKRYETTVQHTINNLQTNYTDLRTEKDQLKESLNSLSQKIEELESKVTSLSYEMKMNASKQGVFFMTNEAKSWSQIRQFCKDRGADLVIVKTENKHMFITSFIKESVWIGLTDRDKEGTMKWVDDSPLNKKFWMYGEPNNYGGNEDCVEMIVFGHLSLLKNWNDAPCSERKKGICEKYV